jgi:hypothetical protein
MNTTTEQTVGYNPYEAFVTLLAELEAEGFFAAMFENDRGQPWLQCHFIT